MEFSPERRGDVDGEGHVGEERILQAKMRRDRAAIQLLSLLASNGAAANRQPREGVSARLHAFLA
jgi:hypothetical protein